MKFQSFRSAVVIASVMVASVTASQVFAQGPVYVFTGLTNENYATAGNPASTYTFTQPMILNSIGFVPGRNPSTGANPLTFIRYSLDGVPTDLTESQLDDPDANGLRWYTLPSGGLSVNASTVLEVTANYTYTDKFSSTTSTSYFKVDSLGTSSNVTYGGLTGEGTNYTNSNLRVSSPTSNVAPEPGSFALALTGGAALLGICIRRRRNAA
jgi:hypothetical protein